MEQPTPLHGGRLTSTRDTIAALATAPGGALAVVRVSGPRALGTCDAVFRGRAALACAAGHTLHVGRARTADGATADEVVAAVFRAPRSYTREDVVELSCHGGRAAARVLAAVCAAGARLAAPGEFTLRAFLHGRLDLAQAEAVADLVQAGSEAARALALSQLAGTLSRTIDALCESLAGAAAEVEARVDFADDVGGVEVPAHVVTAIDAARARVDVLLADAGWARAVRGGARIAIVGAPNAGKSSLFNALLGAPRAIVADVPGTTRDVVSEPAELWGVPVTLCDTAGLRADAGAVEALGIERTRAVLEGCALAVWVVDRSVAFDAATRALGGSLANGARPPRVVALTKADLPARVPVDVVRTAADGAGVVEVSAVRGDGVDALREAMARALGARDGTGLAEAVSNPRHVAALETAAAALGRAARAAADGLPGEIVSLELREAMRAAGEVTGRTVGDDVLARIFERFCIGK